MPPHLARRFPLLYHDKRRARRVRWQASRTGVLRSHAGARWPPSPLHRHQLRTLLYRHRHPHPHGQRPDKVLQLGRLRQSDSYSDSSARLVGDAFRATLLLFSCWLDTCMSHVPVQYIQRFSWAGPAKESVYWKWRALCWSFVHCFFSTTIYSYIKYLFCCQENSGSRRRAEIPRGIELYYFPSNPGTLVEVLLRALVGYCHDGKAFDVRYEGGCSAK